MRFQSERNIPKKHDGCNVNSEFEPKGKLKQRYIPNRTSPNYSNIYGIIATIGGKRSEIGRCALGCTSVASGFRQVRTTITSDHS